VRLGFASRFGVGFGFGFKRRACGLVNVHFRGKPIVDRLFAHMLSQAWPIAAQPGSDRPERFEEAYGPMVTNE
jgi:hypothetical protein